MKTGWCVAFLLWSACGDDGDEREPLVGDGSEKVVDAATLDAALPPLDARVSSIAADATTVADAARSPDAASDAVSPTDAASLPVDAAGDWLEDAGDAIDPVTVRRPTIAKQSLDQVCFPFQRSSPADAPCPDTYCIPGSLSWSVTVPSKPGGFYCISECPPEGMTSLYMQGEIALNLRFSRPIRVDSSSQEILDALVEVGGTGQYPEVTSFTSDKTLLEELRNDNGHLHIVGWGMVHGSAFSVPTLPYLCGSHAPTICTINICQYGVEWTDPRSWFHFDVEAPFSRSYDGTN